MSIPMFTHMIIQLKKIGRIIGAKLSALKILPSIF